MAFIRPIHCSRAVAHPLILREADGPFSRDDFGSTQILHLVLLAPPLCTARRAAPAETVADITSYMPHADQSPPSGVMNDYCRAKGKLTLPTL